MANRFNKVLVANRGEIACRVLRSARAEGYATVAVYSEADRGALHTTLADETVCIGPGVAAESYLKMDAVLDAAKQTGANAIHPGYGFLAENPEFAKACVDAGIVFIGPSTDAILRMGNKAEAKRVMQSADVPCVPGYNGESQEDATLKEEALQIGFPLLLKATAGGGGRGMRRVDAESEWDQALSTARTEAKNAFGSDELIIEKLVEHARHVEVQIIADEHGNCVHLGERDCSVQRRNQKIIEESPCPVMTSVLRDRMGKAAVDAAKAAGYTNAGTIEFLLNDGGDFFFLEMNTRLQVEHPVTELVTGLDLVSLQLQVAQGGALPIVQDDVTFNGHAIEVRICAEDPYADFAPQVGPIDLWQAPEGAGIRMDSGVATGGAVLPFYDSMLAKLIVHGATRDEARTRLIRALRNMAVFGVTTNVEFLQRVLAYETFAEGNATTATLGESGLLDIAPDAPGIEPLAVAAALLIERDAKDVPHELKAWRSTGPSVVPIRLAWKDESFELSVSLHGNDYAVTCGEDTITFTLNSVDGTTVTWDTNGHGQSAAGIANGASVYVLHEGRTHAFEDITYAPPEADQAMSDGLIKSPMSGQVTTIHVSPGDTVAKDDTLLIIEAMKMLNHITAPHDGTIESISVNEGDQVNANQVLVQFTTEDADE